MILEQPETVIEIDVAIISIWKPNIIRIQLKPDSHIDAEEIRQINEAKNKLADKKLHAVVFIPHRSSSITKEARELSIRKEIFDHAVCKTIVAQTLAHRVIGNFFIAVQKPPVPMKLFSNEKEALKWMKEKLENALH